MTNKISYLNLSGFDVSVQPVNFGSLNQRQVEIKDTPRENIDSPEIFHYLQEYNAWLIKETRSSDSDSDSEEQGFCTKIMPERPTGWRHYLLKLFGI